MSDSLPFQNVMVTGATGFVGRSVVRELLRRGLRPVCLVRSSEKLAAQHPEIDPDRLIAIVGTVGNRAALEEAARQSEAAINLVGIILERRLKGQTFCRVHRDGTANLLSAASGAGIKRFVQMSALGTRVDAASAYHKSKWEADELVRKSGLDWTILQPSLILGPQAEFMRLMHQLMCGTLPPVIPYFGNGEARVQPVSVKDVAHCTVESLLDTKSVGQVIPMGGPDVYSWTGLYNACRALMPGAKHWKPMVSQPVVVAKAMALVSSGPMALAETVVPSIGMYRFDCGQVDMSQEDNVCDHTIAEKAFGISMRAFEEELATYADQIQ